MSISHAVMKPKEPITKVKILNSDIEKEHIEDKYSRLDIRATTNIGEQINIEIQVKNEYNMISRTLYYWSKMFEDQLDEGENYNKLAKTVCINILDFKYLKNDRFHNAYRLKEITTNEELTNLQEIHFIELPKMKEINKFSDTTDMLEVWIEFIKNPSSKKVESLEMKMKEIKEAKEELVRLSSDENERIAYNKRKMAILDRVSDLENAEEKGIEKGLVIGKKEGIEEVAKNLLDVLDDETISLKTGLTINEVKNLRK
ncbi:Rpn family recombination-promoting nuclease/putative transposase [Clostridium tarantellae]|uniref:Rpn family recombination-promoting nuclease/putative transposase n=1 Tax=Clostridium tarantellae TaxID=39493 RepID=A0A6I1MQV4_9CLOT|nr:Rpn family recombination-promoting nuclease/putative transposase [Clostridium tarantellae]MPQ45183.1 Rpn family recombination-promoting nuclease/putative transposase [Clostridium tarantellae]